MFIGSGKSAHYVPLLSNHGRDRLCEWISVDANLW
jgi:hypothetical protein